MVNLIPKRPYLALAALQVSQLTTKLCDSISHGGLLMEWPAVDVSQQTLAPALVVIKQLRCSINSNQELGSLARECKLQLILSGFARITVRSIGYPGGYH